MKQVQNYSQGPKFLSVVSRFPSSTGRCLTSHLGHFSGQAAHRPPLAQMTHTCARGPSCNPSCEHLLAPCSARCGGTHEKGVCVLSEPTLQRGRCTAVIRHNAGSSNLAEALWERLGGEGLLPRPGSIQNWTLEVEQNF